MSFNKNYNINNNNINNNNNNNINNNNINNNINNNNNIGYNNNINNNNKYNVNNNKEKEIKVISERKKELKIMIDNTTKELIKDSNIKEKKNNNILNLNNSLEETNQELFHTLDNKRLTTAPTATRQNLKKMVLSPSNKTPKKTNINLFNSTDLNSPLFNKLNKNKHQRFNSNNEKEAKIISLKYPGTLDKSLGMSFKRNFNEMHLHDIGAIWKEDYNKSNDKNIFPQIKENSLTPSNKKKIKIGDGN